MGENKKETSWEEIVAKNKIEWEKSLKKMYPDEVVMNPNNWQQYITDRISRNIIGSNIKNAIDFYNWAKENRHLEYLNGGHGFESRQLTGEEMYKLYEDDVDALKSDNLFYTGDRNGEVPRMGNPPPPTNKYNGSLPIFLNPPPPPPPPERITNPAIIMQIKESESTKFNLLDFIKKLNPFKNKK